MSQVEQPRWAGGESSDKCGIHEELGVKRSIFRMDSTNGALGRGMLMIGSHVFNRRYSHFCDLLLSSRSVGWNSPITGRVSWCGLRPQPKGERRASARWHAIPARPGIAKYREADASRSPQESSHENKTLNICSAEFANRFPPIRFPCIFIIAIKSASISAA